MSDAEIKKYDKEIDLFPIRCRVGSSKSLSINEKYILISFEEIGRRQDIHISIDQAEFLIESLLKQRHIMEKNNG